MPCSSVSTPMSCKRMDRTRAPNPRPPAKKASKPRDFDPLERIKNYFYGNNFLYDFRTSGLIKIVSA